MMPEIENLLNTGSAKISFLLTKKNMNISLPKNSTGKVYFPLSKTSGTVRIQSFF